jgi:hypothetical protein
VRSRPFCLLTCSIFVLTLTIVARRSAAMLLDIVNWWSNVLVGMPGSRVSKDLPWGAQRREITQFAIALICESADREDRSSIDEGQRRPSGRNAPLDRPFPLDMGSIRDFSRAPRNGRPRGRRRAVRRTLERPEGAAYSLAASEKNRPPDQARRIESVTP